MKQITKFYFLSLLLLYVSPMTNIQLSTRQFPLCKCMGPTNNIVSGLSKIWIKTIKTHIRKVTSMNETYLIHNKTKITNL